MTSRAVVAALLLTAGAALAPACSHRAPSTSHPPSPSATARQARVTLVADLDRIFDDPVLARALIGVRVDVLGPEPQALYERNSARLVMPASNMKLLTLAVAAERLGWDYRYNTRLEAAGSIADGVLHGDLVVIGSGDPSIDTTSEAGPAAFAEFAEGLRQAGILRVDGRLIGDDDAFEDEGLGPGWAWDYLSAGYAAPSGALSYNENQIAIRISPGANTGDKAGLEIVPSGHGLTIVNEIVTGDAASPVAVELARLPGSARLTLRGTVRPGGAVLTRTASVDNPTRFFVENMRLALETAGIMIRDGVSDLDDVRDQPPVAERRTIATHESPPLSELAGVFMKVSLNFDTENLLKTVGLVVSQKGTTSAGQDAARETFTAWGIPADAYVMYDGSGLSRYNYVSADAIVTLLTHVWQDDRLRDPFIASLPIAGRDGTLANRMRGTVLEGKVDAKTGTIANVRSLSGFLETKSGGRLVFSMIANHFTATSAEIDAVVERALTRLAEW